MQVHQVEMTTVLTAEITGQPVVPCVERAHIGAMEIATGANNANNAKARGDLVQVVPRYNKSMAEIMEYQ